MRSLVVVHRTDYAYDKVVDDSYGRAHLLPRDEPGQRVLSSAVVISPTPDETHEHGDYFGNRSTYFRVSTPHRELSVVSTSVLEIDRAAVVPATEADPLAVREFLLASPMVPVLPEIAAFAAEVVTDTPDLYDASVTLMHRVHDEFTYTSGATAVSTPLSTVWEEHKGVCQDYAHVLIGALRSAGVPARYVSGYLETAPPPGRPRLVGADASHAWVSAWLPRHGWVDLGPTNDHLIDDRYVVVARARDYSDVPPLKGVIFTQATTSTMTVSVDVRPVLEGAPA